MINMALYKRELKGSVKLLLILGAIITMYVSIIISMYDPEMMKMLDSFAEAMPELMAAVGMRANAANLLGFMVSYLYGFILLLFPMLFCILRGNSLVARYVEKGSMVSLVAAPIKRRAIVLTQMTVLISGILLLILYRKWFSRRIRYNRAFGIKWRTFVFAVIYWRHMFCFFLHIF